MSHITLQIVIYNSHVENRLHITLLVQRGRFDVTIQIQIANCNLQ